jgi:hypothetical protein
MIMKGLLVTVEVTQTSNRYRFDWDQIDMTKEQFDALSHEEKKEIVQAAIDDLPDQPCWIVDDWSSNG